MKSKKVGLRNFAMQLVVLAGFSLMQGCTTGDSPIRWLNWPYSTPKDQPVILPPSAGQDISSIGIMPVDDTMPVITPDVSSSRTHRVQKGETLSTIASSYGTSWQKLASHNNLSNPNKLKVGQELLIPGSLGGPSPVKRSSSAPASKSSSSSIKQGTTYTIQKGDALSTIAKRSGLTISEIKAANGMQSDSIIAGKKLTIPRKGEAKAAVATKTAPAKVSKPAPAPAPVPAPIQSAAPASTELTDPNLVVDEPTAGSPVAPVATSPNAPVYEHVLYPGETLEDVARQYGSSQQDIMTLNNITDPASVKAGTKLLVPMPE